MNCWILAGFVALASLPVSGTTLFTFTSAPTTHDSQLSFGYSFVPNLDISITSLGYFDATGTGLITSHNVGIFDSVGNPLASTTVASGTVDPLTGQFRYAAITPLTLAAGQTYIAAATNGGLSDAFMYGTTGTITGFSADPSVTLVNGNALFLYQGDNTLRFPTNSSGYVVYGGPNFQFDVLVPEPGAAGLLIAAFGLAVFRKRL
jgi:hypothetical protein